VFMLRPPSSAYDEHAILDMVGGSNAHAALCLRMGSLLDQALTDGPVWPLRAMHACSCQDFAQKGRVVTCLCEQGLVKGNLLAHVPFW